MNKLFSFFRHRDPDLEIFSQAFAMLISNLLGLFLWVILRYPCSMLIVLAPGIIVAIVFKETQYTSILKISFLTSTVISIFYVGTIMLYNQPLFQIVWFALIIYYIFSSYKTRYLASFALLPCSLAFHMPLGAISAVNRVIESYLSALLAIIAVILIKELAAKYKIKRMLLLLVLETNNLYKLKLSGKTGSDKKIMDSEIKIKKLTLKSVYLINRYVYLQKSNRNYSQHASLLLDVTIKISRAVTMLNPVMAGTVAKNHYLPEIRKSSISPLIQAIDNNLNNIYVSIASNRAINIQSIDLSDGIQNRVNFNNYFSLKNLIMDMENINSFQLQ